MLIVGSRLESTGTALRAFTHVTASLKEENFSPRAVTTEQIRDRSSAWSVQYGGDCAGPLG